MAFRCGQNYTDGKNMLKVKSKLVKYIDAIKKYESRFEKYMFMNEKKNSRVDILKFEFVLVFFTDSTTRGTNEMTSEWNYKNQNSSDEGKGNLVRVIPS